ncbi:hypothetical protein N7540_006561 [Penicillium herquei]|nr:hypothetical protein N7540_006561 [Penicillium herquei]
MIYLNFSKKNGLDRDFSLLQSVYITPLAKVITGRPMGTLTGTIADSSTPSNPSTGQLDGIAYLKSLEPVEFAEYYK